MFIKITSQSTDFPDYFFNEYIGLECEVERTGETNTKGELTGQKQPCYYVKTGLSEIPLIAVPIVNAEEVQPNATILHKILNAIEATRILFEDINSHDELIYLMVYKGKMKIDFDKIKIELKKNDNYVVKEESDTTIEVYSKSLPDRIAFATITNC